MAEALFQDQFRAITLLVQGIESSVEAVMGQGGEGFPIASVAAIAKTMRLSVIGQQIMRSMIDQSDTIGVSACGTYYVVKHRLVIDADWAEAS